MFYQFPLDTKKQRAIVNAVEEKANNMHRLKKQQKTAQTSQHAPALTTISVTLKGPSLGVMEKKTFWNVKEDMEAAFTKRTPREQKGVELFNKFD